MAKRELNLDVTESVEKALGIMLQLLHTYGSRKGVPAKALAIKMWPTSPGWVNQKDASYRHKGKGPVYAATNMMVRLERMKLAERTESGGYRLTGSGLITTLEADKREREYQDRKKARLK